MLSSYEENDILPAASLDCKSYKPVYTCANLSFTFTWKETPKLDHIHLTPQPMYNVYEYNNPNLGEIFFTYIAIAAGTVWATEQERLPEQGRKCLVSKVCGSCVGRTLTVT